MSPAETNLPTPDASAPVPPAAISSADGAVGERARGLALVRALVKLSRPHQWAKGVFVLVGPLYGGRLETVQEWLAVLGALLAFNFASSACYVINDLRDAEADRAHPRKRRRPIASGAVSPGLALGWALVLGAWAVAALGLVAWPGEGGIKPAGLLAAAVGLYALNVTAYSFGLKHLVIVDVMGLSIGFVLRVLGGCAAVAVEPSSWLLNVTFFLAMFLAFGKRLGERRTMGSEVASARSVQAAYTDELLRMLVVVTGVATLLTYAGYVQAQGARYTWGFNLLWVTMLPATYGLLRCIVLLEKGRYDDPTELAANDRPFQLAGGVFGLTTVVLLWAFPLIKGLSNGPAAH
jgi:decaprenyl-phosphate phosphoribosyltransferase